MNCLTSIVIFMLIATPPQCFATDKKSESVLLDYDELIRDRHIDCFACFTNRFGEHVEKKGRVARFDECFIYYEWRDYRVEKKKETGYISSIRVHAIGRVVIRGWGSVAPPVAEERLLKDLEDSASRIESFRFILYLSPKINVKDTIDFIANCLGIDDYTSRARKLSGNDFLSDFLEKHSGVLRVSRGGYISFRRPGQLKADKTQSGLPVEVYGSYPAGLAAP